MGDGKSEPRRSRRLAATTQEEAPAQPRPLRGKGGKGVRPARAPPRSMKRALSVAVEDVEAPGAQGGEGKRHRRAGYSEVVRLEQPTPKEVDDAFAEEMEWGPGKGGGAPASAPPALVLADDEAPLIEPRDLPRQITPTLREVDDLFARELAGEGGGAAGPALFRCNAISKARGRALALYVPEDLDPLARAGAGEGGAVARLETPTPGDVDAAFGRAMEMEAAAPKFKSFSLNRGLEVAIVGGGEPGFTPSAGWGGEVLCPPGGEGEEGEGEEGKGGEPSSPSRGELLDEAEAMEAEMDADLARMAEEAAERPDGRAEEGARCGGPGGARLRAFRRSLTLEVGGGGGGGAVLEPPSPDRRGEEPSPADVEAAFDRELRVDHPAQATLYRSFALKRSLGVDIAQACAVEGRGEGGAGARDPGSPPKLLTPSPLELDAALDGAIAEESGAAKYRRVGFSRALSVLLRPGAGGGGGEAGDPPGDHHGPAEPASPVREEVVGRAEVDAALGAALIVP